MPYETEPIPRLPLRATIVLVCAMLGTAVALWTWRPAPDVPMLASAVFAESAVLDSVGAHPPPIEDDVWETLAEYTYEVFEDFEYEVTFSEAVQALHETEVTLKGYIIPLEQGITVTHFLLSTFPLADCYYCMPGGPESFVEVMTDDPIAFTYEPLTLRGTFAVLEKEEIDQMGMFYRMTDAKYVDE
ncbi:MAG: DUF3299 domain-containing protein [Bacteroidota bacterium]